MQSLNRPQHRPGHAVNDRGAAIEPIRVEVHATDRGRVNLVPSQQRESVRRRPIDRRAGAGPNSYHHEPE